MADIVGRNGQREEFRVVGKPNKPGILSYALASGVAKFGADYTAPDMLHAKFLRSPYAHARVNSIKTDKAWKVPGVVDIVLWDDPDLMGLGGMPFGPKKSYLGNVAHQENQEVGAIVVAETEDACEEALRALEVDWEVLPFIVDLRKGGTDPTIPTIREPEDDAGGGMFGGPAPGGKPKEGNWSYQDKIEGDMAAGEAAADYVIEYDTNLPIFASHIPNAVGSIAWWFDDPYHGPGKSLHIEGAVQRRGNIAQMYGVPNEKCVQEGLFQGGKYCDWGLRMSQEITPLLAKRTGRPVRCVNTREETFDFLMNARLCHIRLGFTKDGLITFVDDQSIADNGRPGSSSFGVAQDQGYGPYYTLKCQNISQRYKIVDTNSGKMYTSGQHCPFNWDTLTMGLAIMADKLGKDPMELAQLNLHGPTGQDDMNKVPSFEACIAEGKKLAGWNWHPSGTKRLPDGRLHGASFRYQICPRHAFSGYDCKLELRNGVVHLPTQGPCTGIYAVEANAMVVAEELGLEYEDIAVDFDYRETFTPVGGGADGTTASAWAMKE